MKKLKSLFVVFGLVLFAVLACQTPPEPIPQISRAESIPTDVTKITPEMDLYPPILHSDEWESPVPVDAPVSTTGAEDSPFITPDGNTLYFFFTPDVRVPVEQQIVDGVTGIYSSTRWDGVWSEPERVILQDPGELSMDGCEFVQGNVMWFCSVRVGNLREIDLYTAVYENGRWTNWENAGEKLNLEIGVGEMHITADGSELYFHSDIEGGLGGVDIWVTRLVDGEWSDAENVTAVNSSETDGWPFIAQDGAELWFLRWYQGTPGIFRSLRVGGEWDSPELIVSQFAGEPSLDNQGNLYFVHHYYKDGVMLEADIYVAYKK